MKYHIQKSQNIKVRGDLRSQPDQSIPERNSSAINQTYCDPSLKSAEGTWLCYVLCVQSKKKRYGFENIFNVIPLYCVEAIRLGLIEMKNCVEDSCSCQLPSPPPQNNASHDYFHSFAIFLSVNNHKNRSLGCLENCETSRMDFFSIL